MIESNNDFDDFDIADDIDDPWDDDIISSDESDNVVETASSTSNSNGLSKIIIKSLVVVTILGSASYFALPFIIPQNDINQIPVIKLDKPIDVEILSSNPNTPSNAATLSIINDVESNGNVPSGEKLPLAKGFIEHQEKTIATIGLSDKVGVLTPMPSIDSKNEVPLSELIVIARQEEANKALASIEDTGIKTLNEDELQSKIDKKIKYSNFDIEVKDISSTSDKKIQSSKPLISEPPVKEVIQKSETKINDINDINDVVSKVYDKDLDTIKSKEVVKPKEVTKTKKQVKAKKPRWIIRAAQAGSALIYNKTSREMKSIEVNDVVNGLGRIKSIKIIDGAWVITGTLSKIEQ